MEIRDLAIVLRTVPFAERDRVVTALTENHGRISAIARGAVQSRRFGGALDIFTAAEWRFVERPGASLFRLEEARVRRGFEGLRRDFERLAAAGALNEILLRLAPEREACPELFRLHSNALAALEEGATILPLLNAYVVKALRWSGSQPRLSACLGCATPLAEIDPAETLSCKVDDAGWACARCRDATWRARESGDGQNLKQSLLRVSPRGLMDLDAAAEVPIREAAGLARASENEHRGVFAFLEAVLSYHLPGFAAFGAQSGSGLKSLRFLGLGSNPPLAPADRP